MGSLSIMSLPLVTPEGTVTTSSQSSVVSLIPENPISAKRALPKGRVFIHRLPGKTSFITATSDRYVYDDDFPSIAASDSTHACFSSPRIPRDCSPEPDRASFRDKLRRLSKRADTPQQHDSVIHDLRQPTRQVGCAEFLATWFGRKDKELHPPIWQDDTEQEDTEQDDTEQDDDFQMFSVVGYDDFMHGARRPSAAARVMARIRRS